MNNSYYYIVAFDNPVKFIHLDNNNLKEKDRKNLHKLSYIDYITSQFDENVFRNYLFKNNIISDINTTILIAKKRKYDNQEFIKYYKLLFKNNNSFLLNNIALSNIRKRQIALFDCGLLLQKFKDNYYRNPLFKDLIEYYLNSHDIEHILLYKDYVKKEKNVDKYLKYPALRNVVLSLNEIKKYNNFSEFLISTGTPHSHDDEVIELLNSYKEEKDNIEAINNISKEQETEQELKNMPWDNKIAGEHIANSRFIIEEVQTLTLEDRVRAGLMPFTEYKKWTKTLKNKK